MDHVHPLASPRVAMVALIMTSLGASPSRAVVVEDWAMGDGVTLHTRIYAPNDDLVTPRGVLLVRTPYGAAAAAEGHIFDLLLTDAAYVNARGIVYVTQDVRGTGASSGGPTVRFIDDSADTDDTIGLITAAPWSNGKVAMWGPSALGISSLLAIQHPPPGLEGVMALIATGDVREAFYPGGALREEMAAGWLPEHGGDGVLEIIRAHEEDGAFWDEGRLSDEEIASSSVKTLILGGVFDVFGPGSARTHERLRALSANPDEHFLLLGPWTHDSVLPANGADLAGAFVGDLKLPLAAFVFFGQPIDPASHFNQFLGWTLLDQPAPTYARARTWLFDIRDAPEPFTSLQVTGGWVGYDAWPPPDVEEAALYLHDDGTLGLDVDPDGVARQIIVDPEDPAPTIGGARLIVSGGPERRAGPRDQSALFARDDVLVFETPDATQTVEIVGDLRAEIWAASSADDIDVHVKLMQRTNAGVAFLLADGVRRGRFVDGADALVPLVPGAPRRFDVDLGPIALRLRAGHGLIVAIQGANFDRFDVNPHRAIPMVQSPSPQKAALTVYTDDAHPSAIILPVTTGVPPSAPLPTTHPEPPDPRSPEGGPLDDGGAGDGDDDDDDDDDVPGDGGGDGSAAPVGCGCATTNEAPRAHALALAAALVGLALRRRFGRRRHATPR